MGERCILESPQAVLSSDQVSSLLELSKKLLAAESFQGILDTVVEESIGLLQAERGFLVRKEKGQLVFYRTWGAAPVGLGESVSRQIVTDALASQSAILVEDAYSHPRYCLRESVRSKRVRSVLAAPLDVDEDIVLYLESRRADSLFDQQDLVLFREILQLSSRTLRQCVRRVMSEESKSLFEEFDFRGIVAQDQKSLEVLKLVAKVAGSREPVLVQGPSGAGKELLVRALHRNSDRAARPLMIVNCGAIAPNLLESELFGYVRGAFTGAVTHKEGLIPASDSGTVFLDEISELSLDLQVKLLRAIQFGEVRPVGSTQVREVDVRFLTASNRDLEEEVKAGRFREDLFYRINTVTILVPPLRDRRADILPLFDRFLERAAAKEGRAVPKVSSELEQLLLSYTWPGNVRELENEARRLVVLVAEGEMLQPEHVSTRIRSGDAELTDLEVAERQLIENHLRSSEGNKSQAARSLGISREGLRKKMKRLGMS